MTIIANSPATIPDYSPERTSAAVGADRIDTARSTLLIGSALLLVVGLVGGQLAVNPIALGVSLLLLKKVLDGKSWARGFLVAQQLFSAIASPLLMAAVASNGSQSTTTGIAVALTVIAVGIGATVAGLLMTRPVSDYLAANK